MLTSSIISNEASNLLISGTKFEKNTLGKSVVDATRGTHLLLDTEFRMNAVSRGVVFVSVDANLEDFEGESFCGLDNTADENECTGVLFQVTDSGNCTDGDAIACETNECQEMRTCEPQPDATVAPSLRGPSEPSSSLSPAQVAPSLSPTRGAPSTVTPTAKEPCFDQWPAFFDAVNQAADGDSFVLCAGTEFDLSTEENEEKVPLKIFSNDLSIRCASRRQNSCVWSGGEEQVAIEGSVTGLVLRGITFVGSRSTSVIADVSPPFSMEFLECDWKVRVLYYFTNKMKSMNLTNIKSEQHREYDHPNHQQRRG